MISLRRNKRKIYVCNAYFDANIKKYDEPIELYENYQITSGLADFEKYGLDAYQYIRIKTNSTNAKYYNIGDRVYINVTPPEEHDIFCKNADYEVSEDPITTLNETEVLLRRRSGKK